MKKVVLVLGLLVLFASAGVRISSGDNPRQPADLKKKPVASRTAYAPDRLLVKFKDDPSGMPAAAGRAHAESAYGLAKAKHYRLINAYLYKVGGDLIKTLKKLRKLPNVAYAEPDYVRATADHVPNDPSFNQLWAMNNTGQTGGTPGADMDMLRAWDITTGSDAVVVGVIDTGVQYDHPDLAANMWTNPREIPGNRIDDDRNGYIDDVYGINAIWGNGNPRDDNGHGTHCSGTIAAVGNNGTGVVGVCWKAKIMALKFLGSDGAGYTSDAITCVEYAIANGAHILSNSWGGGGRSTALADAIEAAGRAGILFVAAAGNDGADIDYNSMYPAGYQNANILAVAATDHNDARPEWSNYGKVNVDVAAPGVDIYSTFLNGSYEAHSGTSMATPHVAGLAALMKSLNPMWDWRQLKLRIMAGVEVLPQLESEVLTGGRVNAYNSLMLPEIVTYQLDVRSSSGEALPITVNPPDVDGNGSGVTSFVRYYAPNTEVMLMAPAVQDGRPFSFWTLDGVPMSWGVTLSFRMDFNHVVVPHYGVPLNEALDNPSLSFVSGGYGVGWVGQTAVSLYGGASVRNRPIGDNQSAYLQTSVIGPGNISFFCKTSSEEGYDFLRFYVDDLDLTGFYMSGECDWMWQTCIIPDGIHVVKWVYSKDVIISAGADCGYVDAVSIYGRPATLAGAVDDDMGVWTTSDGGGWFSQGNNFYYDNDAGQTSPLLDGQQASIQTVIDGPTTGSYYWKVSSEADYDLLTFSIDDVPQASISGEIDWRQESFTLGPGSHVLKWVYAKDDMVAGGADAAWLDRVQYDVSGSHDLMIRTATAGGGTGGTTDPAPGTRTYDAGEMVSITAIPSEGYRFSGWTGDVPAGHDKDNPLVVGMNSSRAITANFLLRVTLTVSTATEYGEYGGSAEPSGGIYDYGSHIAVRAWPAGRVRFTRWTGDVPPGLSTDNPIDILMDGNKALTANFLFQFCVNIFAATIDGVNGGNTSPQHGYYEMDPLTEFPLRAFPAPDFRFSGWSGDVRPGHESDNPLPVVMDTSDKRFQARFTRNIYAPQTIAGRHVYNRSVFLGEYVNELTWAPDPRNTAPGLTISNYRIYLIGGGGKTLLVELEAGARSYLHRNVARDGIYTYAICAVNPSGREGDYGLISFNGSAVSTNIGQARAGAEAKRGVAQTGRKAQKIK